MQPTPGQVLTAALRAAHDPWPLDDQKRAEWFASLGLTPTRPVGNWDHWGTGIEGWGDTHICWSCHHTPDGAEFAGLGWFLWGDASTQRAGQELFDLLTQRFGPAQERAGTGGRWRWWQVGDRYVEFGRAIDDPRLQLHVVVAEFADDPCPERLQEHVPAA